MRRPQVGRASERLGLLSDLDGTLVDSRDANLESYRIAFAEIGLPFDGALYSRAFGLAFDEMMHLIAPGVGDETLLAVKEAKARAYRDRVPGMRVNSALISLLADAHERGRPTALVTTARRTNVARVVEAFDLGDVFDAVICAEDVDRGKPAPDCYLAAASALELKPEDCVVFEDSPVGVAAAERAGCLVMKVVL